MGDGMSFSSPASTLAMLRQLSTSATTSRSWVCRNKREKVPKTYRSAADIMPIFQYSYWRMTGWLTIECIHVTDWVRKHCSKTGSFYRVPNTVVSWKSLYCRYRERIDSRGEHVFEIAYIICYINIMDTYYITVLSNVNLSKSAFEGLTRLFYFSIKKPILIIQTYGWGTSIGHHQMAIELKLRYLRN